MIDRAQFEREGVRAGLPASSATEIARHRPKLPGLDDALPAAGAPRPRIAEAGDYFARLKSGAIPDNLR